MTTLQKPAALKPGDKIAVVAPSGKVDDERLKAGIAALERAGFAVETADNILARKGYLAGEAAGRAAALRKFFERPDIAAIMAARGGFGSIQMLPYLDADAIRRHPKIFVGYSDLSIVINWLVQRCGMVAFHGPMVAMELARGLDGRNADFFWGTLTGKKQRWEIDIAETVQSGIAEGESAGGCLSTVVTTIGTPYEIDTAGKMLFLEDVAEKPYRIERMLTHMKMAGKLDRVAGVVFGSFSYCEGDGEREVAEVIREMFRDAPYPVATGVPAGHGDDNIILPLGVKMRLDGAAGRLSLIEPPVHAPRC
ncbi:MAG TPA: LD-carboxypeptidase [Candidatus Binatia bacterium]